MQGEQYIAVSGKVVEGKQVIKVDCSKCKFKCSEHINSVQQEEINNAFYEPASYERQKQFICSQVTETTTPDTTATRKNVTRSYSFIISEGAGDKRVRICKKFFLATIAVGQKYVLHAVDNSEGGTFTIVERRGKQIPHNKTNDEVKEGIKQHIESFPTVPSHYT